MIIATVTTCPQRWLHYQRLRRNYERLGIPASLRTFQTEEGCSDPRVNANLNARAALAYADHHLRDHHEGWMLYLEDDVVLGSELPAWLDFLVARGEREAVDCWYLCNRRNAVRTSFRLGSVLVAELVPPIMGTHALMLPKRHLQRLLKADWSAYTDQAILANLSGMGGRVWQVLEPVLGTHAGEWSTFEPSKRRNLEVNHANPSDLDPAG